MSVSADLVIFWVVVLARILVPLTIPRYPLPGILAALILDAVDQIPLGGLDALDREDIVRVDRPLGEVIPGLDRVSRVNSQVLTLRDDIALFLAGLVLDDELAHTSSDRAKLDDAVDLRDHGGFLRFAALEELGDTRQTAGDITRLADVFRNLAQLVACGTLPSAR